MAYYLAKTRLIPNPLVISQLERELPGDGAQHSILNLTIIK